MKREIFPLGGPRNFNYPNEITEESFQAIKVLRELGIPVGNQCVLLKGVNDDTDVIRRNQ
jgi:lysine 2,3-aminomutase